MTADISGLKIEI